MIFFYSKKINKEKKINKGDIFGVIDGRVHNKEQLKCFINIGLKDDDIGRYIIGHIVDGNNRVAYNLDKIKILENIESVSEESPLNYRVDVEKGKLVKK